MASSSTETSELTRLCEAIVNQSQSGEEIEICVATGIESEIRAYDGDVESLSSASSSGVGIRVLLDSTQGGRVGFAWAGSLERHIVADVLASARENAKYATPDPFVAFAKPDGVDVVDLDLFDERASLTSMGEKVEATLALESDARSRDTRIRQVDSADYGDASIEVVLLSSAGMRAVSRRSTAFMSVSVIAGDESESQTGVGFSVGRSLGDLDGEFATSDAIDRAVRLLGAEKARSGRLVAIFDARVVSSLLGIVASAMSAESVAKQRSIFTDRIGEQIAVAGLDLVDDPTDHRAYGASSYDGEGLASRKNHLIRDGELVTYLYDTVSARRLGTSSNGCAVRGGFAGTPGPGARALRLSSSLEGTNESEPLGQAEIMRRVGTGFFIQSVTGIHSGVNPISGDFSVGAEGLLVKNGEFAEPVREVTVASTLQRMLQSIVHVGNDLEWLPGIAAGQTLAIADMQLSGS